VPSESLAGVSDQEMYDIEEIVDSKSGGDLASYKARWVGYLQDSKYYSAENFRGAQKLVGEFHKRYPQKPGPGIGY